MRLSLRHATRRLARSPRFALAAILTLALGLGATTSALSVVNAVLVRPLPYPQPDRLVSLSHTLVVGGALRVDQSDATLLFYKRHSRAFSHLGGYQIAAAALGPAAGTEAERVPAGRVTADVFPALRVPPLRGRLFAESDDRPGAAPVVLIAERLWARKYGADPELLNRRLDIDGVAHEVIGIMPARLGFPAPDTELWVPMRLDSAATESATFDYQAIARLRDGESIDRAEEDLQTLLPHLPDEFPGRMTRASIEQTRMRASVRPLAAVVVGDAGRLLWVILGASALMLAIACINVTNLFLVRVEERRPAFAIQRALGAPRRAVLLESLSEVLVVATLAGALGTVIAAAGVARLRTLGYAIDLPRLAEVSVDSRILAVAGLVSVCCALFVSGLPAVISTGASTSLLQISASRPATAGRGRHRARQLLVVSQVAIALVLLVAAGLMAKSVWRLRSMPSGFEAENTISFRLALPPATYPTPDESVRFFVRALDAIATIPGIEIAGAVSKLPLDHQGRTDSAVFVEDRPIPPGSLPGIHPVSYVTPGYFAAAGIPLIAGRSLTRPDPPHFLPEAIVSRAFAERYWPGESPIGRRLRIFSTGPWYTVVGVAGNVRDSALDQAVDQMVYCPLLPAREDPRWTPRDLAVVVRTADHPVDFAAGIRQIIRSLDPSLPMYRVRPLTGVVAFASARRSLAFVLMAGASGIALLLGAVGLYGVMSYVVKLRTREIGIRLALGAAPGEVRRMVSRQGFGLGMLGIAVGLAGAAVLTRFLSALLFEVSPTDKTILAAAAAVLSIVAAAASWFPAREAAAIDPASALRAE